MFPLSIDSPSLNKHQRPDPSISVLSQRLGRVSDAGIPLSSHGSVEGAADVATHELDPHAVHIRGRGSIAGRAAEASEGIEDGVVVMAVAAAAN